MKARILIFATIVCSLSGSDLRAQQHDSITAQQIIQKYIAARGGLDKIKAVRTLVLKGPPRPNGKPGRQMRRMRPFYLSIGTEGNDGAPWESYDSYGLIARVSGAPATALRHTAYFDDALIMSLEVGWHVELTGSELVNGRDSYRLRVTYPDGFVNELFVDKQTWLLDATRSTVLIHAFGEAVTGETFIGDYRNVQGALFPARFSTYNLSTGIAQDDGVWETVEGNVPLTPADFAPPVPSNEPVARLVNAIFSARIVPADALGWYHDFLQNPATSNIDIEGAIESVSYHCLKSGAVATGMALLKENLARHPQSAAAHFGLGRAYRAAEREDDALAEFHESLRIDPKYQPAIDAIASKVLVY